MEIIEIPVNIEAEQAILLSCFLSEDALYTAIEEVAAIDFHAPGHNFIFSIIKDLSSQDISIDKTTVSAKLVDDVTKESFANMFERDDVSASNIEAYCTVVKEYTKLRLALEASYNIQKEIRLPDRKADLIIQKAEDLLFKAVQREDSQQFKTMSDIIDEAYSNIKVKSDHRKGELIGLTTTIPTLDVVSYGLERQSFNIIAGRPSMGKTELALQILVGNAAKGYPGAIFSIEQPDSELMERMIANYLEIGLSKIKKGYLNREEVSKIEASYGDIKNLPIYIDDTPNISIAHLVAKSKRLKQKIPNLSCIFIDYLQLMDSSSERANNRNEEMTHISRALKVLSRTLDLPVIALSQLSRECEKRDNKRPLLSDLRESGAIEQDADKVFFMYSDYPYLNKKEAGEADRYKGEIILAKHRNGPTDTVFITNNKPIQKFYDVEDLKPEHVGYEQAIEASAEKEDDDLPF